MKQIIISLLIINALFTNVKAQNTQTDSQLAAEYYRTKEYDKAATLYLNLFETTSAKVYFTSYVRCLANSEKYEEAEKAVKKQIKKDKKDPSLYIELGYIYDMQELTDKAEENYNEAINNTPADQTQIKQVANAFLSKQKYAKAISVYEKGRELLSNSYSFRYEIAGVYLVERDYPNMVNEYLLLLDEDASYLTNIQNRLQYYITNDIDKTMKTLLKNGLLEKIQTSKNSDVFSELLIWLLIQEKEFSAAFFQVKALDKRNLEDGNRVLNLGQLAEANDDLEVAQNCYQYVADKGVATQYYSTAKLALLNIYYTRLINGVSFTEPEIKKLEAAYQEAVKEFGINSVTIDLITDYAHLLAFYLNKSDSAMELLEAAIAIPRLNIELLSKCRLEMADIMLLTDDVWEATLLYAKVEKDNSENPIGHEAKFRKARLAFFIGNFEWAQAQLDVLKGSTSKLIANDAFELSLLISDNSALDTTTTALAIYARAELLLLQNKDSLANLTFDSILTNFQKHSLVDDVYFKKAEIAVKKGDYENAVTYYTEVADKHSWEILADNAMYKLGIIYEEILKDKEKAMEYYKNVMVKYSGSLFVVDSRARFRKLRGDLR